MDQPTGTLLAAIVAAFASIICLFVSLANQKGAEFRGAHRKILEKHIEDLSEAIHQMLASCDVIVKRIDKGQDVTEWISKFDESKSKIEAIRRKLRYPLWGIDGGIRSLVRLKDWVLHVKIVPGQQREILDMGEGLRKAVDGAIKYSYVEGSPPNLFHRVQVYCRVVMLKRAYKKAMKMSVPAA